jgi:hypothetical protein
MIPCKLLKEKDMYLTPAIPHSSGISPEILFPERLMPFKLLIAKRFAGIEPLS